MEKKFLKGKIIEYARNEINQIGDYYAFGKN